MENNKNFAKILFLLIQSEICGRKLDEKFIESLSPEILESVYKLAKAHDISHIVASALNKYEKLSQDEISKKYQKQWRVAVYRYEITNHEFDVVCKALEAAKIPFMPLKGSVIRKYYPEPWMRTSCDIDILIRETDLEKAKACLEDTCNYTSGLQTTHDISFFSSSKTHIELHYDLIEDGRANASQDVLKNVWQTSTVKDGKEYEYQMTDEMFYFYHIAHMAAHFEVGGCGIRPFIDLWILDNIKDFDKEKRDALLKEGNLLKFADSVRKLSRIWLENEEYDSVSQQMENYILRGGVYGVEENRIAVQQQKKGGKLKYAYSKIWLPYEKIKFYFPSIGKYKVLTPLMEILRWCKIIFGGRLKSTTDELVKSSQTTKTEADAIKSFLDNVGL